MSDTASAAALVAPASAHKTLLAEVMAEIDAVKADFETALTGVTGSFAPRLDAIVKKMEAFPAAVTADAEAALSLIRAKF